MNSKDSKNFLASSFYRTAKEQFRKYNIPPPRPPTQIMEVRAGEHPLRKEKAISSPKCQWHWDQHSNQPAGRQNQILFQTRGEKGRGGEVWNQEKWIHLLQKIKTGHTKREKQDWLVLSIHTGLSQSLICFHYPQISCPWSKEPDTWAQKARLNVMFKQKLH